MKSGFGLVMQRATRSKVYGVALIMLMSQAAVADDIAVSAKAYVLVDRNSRQILSQKAEHEPFQPASTTKLMTAYVVFKALKAQHVELQQQVLISGDAWRQGGTTMYLRARMRVAVEDLVKGMLVQSGNDAAHVLAETVGGTVEQFVAMMNREAQALGMRDTLFRNPTGLPEDGHLSTANDLSLLAVRLLDEFPEYAHYFAIKAYHYPGTPVANSVNKNTLLHRDPTVTGMKTGYTQAAGYCLVASASRSLPGEGDRGLVLVLLGAASDKHRVEEAGRLLNWGYRAYQNVRLERSETLFEDNRVWKGAQSRVSAGVLMPVAVSLPADEREGITTQAQIIEPIIAPVQPGQQLGVLQVSYKDRVIKSVPIVALERVEEAGFFGRLWGSFCLTLRRLLVGWGVM